MKKKSFLPIIGSIAVAIGLIWIANNSKSVGKMTDKALAIDNLKRGIANGWYTAQLTMVDGVQAVRLSGKLTNGKYYSDVYPITPEVASELKRMGVKEV